TVVASTAQFQGTLTNATASVTVTGTGNLAGLGKVTAGTLVFGTGIPANTTVLSRTDNALTLSAPATSAGAQTLTFLTPDVARTAASTTNGSQTVTLSKVSDLRIGMLVFGNGVPDNTRITAITGLTITLSKSLTSTTTANTLSFVNTSSLGYVAEWDATSFRTGGTNALSLSVTPSGTPTSLAFSPLDVNLWHPTDFRGTTATADQGHGVPYTSDNSRAGSHLTRMDVFGGQNTFDQDVGGTSMAFSLEDYNTNPRASNVYYVATGGSGQNGQFGVVTGASYHWQEELTANPNIVNNYNLPGGAYGSVISNPFSLAGYTYTDKPTLYFNYWLQTEDVNSISAMRDSARVYASTDGGATWQLLATNNNIPSITDTASYELPAFPSVSSRISTNSNQKVQQLYDTASWRQARIDLGELAGNADIRLRFDFHTAGQFDTTQVDAAGNLVNAFGDTSNSTGQFTNTTRGQNNAFGGFQFDDVIVGFAERGEIVTGTTGAAAEIGTFYNIATPTSATVAPQSLFGSYQLEIRRGTEYGSQADPSSPVVQIDQTFDTNVRFVPTLDAPAVTIRGDGFEAVTRTSAVTLQATGTDAVSWTNHGLIAGTPVVFTALPAGSNLVAGNTYYVVNVKTNSFDVARTQGGVAITLLSAGNAAATAVTTAYSTVSFQASGTGAAGATGQYTDVAPHAGTTFAPATGGRFAVLTGAAGADRSQAFWDVSLADATALKTAAYLQYAYINTAGRNALAKTFTMTTAADAPAGMGVALSVDGGRLWTSIQDISLTPYGDAVPEDGLPFGNGVPPTWHTAGVDLMAALAAAGYAAGTVTTNGLPQVTVPSTASLVPGMAVAGAGIPANTTILSVDSKTRITLSANATATAAGVSLTFTPPGGTALTLPGTVRIGFFQSGTGGFVALDDLQVLPAVPTPATGTIGDRDLIRPQGQFIIANNIVSDAQTYGISIDAGVRDTTSNVPHPGVPANLRNPNTGRLAPGAVVVNNIVSESGTAGIRFSGDANTTMPSAIPYGRIVNNTVFGGATFQAGLTTTNKSTAASVDPLFVPYLQTGMTVSGTGLAAGTTITAINAATGGVTLSAAATASGTGTSATFTSPNTAGTGVIVSDNAAPTLLNNVFARVALGVSVDGTSRVDSTSNLRTVIGANAYYQVGTQIGGTAGLFQNDAVTVTVDPFVKSYAGNFYPAPSTGGSPSIIDSSLNTLQDRNEYRAVVAPLGIPASPIIAPALDIYGQLRADDPGVASSPGLGANPFKDRGAVDRVDTKQPTASLAVPLDGSTIDKALATGVARVVGGDTAGVYRFVIQLADQGIGVDNTTILPGFFTVQYADRSGVVSDWSKPPAGTTVQTLDATTTNGYVFRYLENTKQVILESIATFAPGDYLVTIDNTKIADLAGLKLLNNDVNGTGTTAFKIALVDIPAAPTGLVLTTAPAVESAKLTVAWTAPTYDGSASITGYRLQTSTDNLVWTTVPDANLVRTSATATTATITGLTNGTPYFIRVAAVNSANGGSPADTTQINWSAATAPIAPLSAPALSLRTDSGSSGADGITNDPRVNVALDPGVSLWKYSLNGGATWTVGAGAGFTLPADGTYPAGTLKAQQSLLGFDGPIFTLATSIQLDTGVPARVVLANGTGVGLTPAGGATRAEAKQGSGVVTVRGEAGVDIEVVFTGAGGGKYTANLLGDGTAQAVSLTDANLATLGEGNVTVTASQTDTAGNRSPLPDVVVSFTLDTVAPAAPVLTLGAGVDLAPAGGATAAEATDPAGVVTVTAENGAGVVVLFSGTNGTVTKTVTGQGATPVAVTLVAGDLTTLGQGTVEVLAIAADAAGNPSPAGTASFTLDTAPPATPALALGDGVGDLPDGGATAAEATQISGVVTVQAEAGTSVLVVFYGQNGNVQKTIVADGTVQAVILDADDLTTLGEGEVNVTATATDLAGNESDIAGPITFNLDVTAPDAAVLVLSPTVDPTVAIRIPRALSNAGIVTVSAEPGATITVTFTATDGLTTNTETVTVLADGTPQPVSLTRDQIDALCTFDGSIQPDVAIDVSAAVTDPAGNPSAGPDPFTAFLLDAVAPPAPTVVLAADADFATKSEATAAAGIILVTAIAGNDVAVTFTGTLGTVTVPTFTATGAAQPVVLSDADVLALGDGVVSVSVVQTDPATGNPSRSTDVGFTLDTVPPAAPDVKIGLGVLGGATAAEAAVGAVTVAGEDLASIVVTFTGTAGTVTKSFTGNGAVQPVILADADIATLGQGLVSVSAVQTDPAGNKSPAGTTTFTIDTVAPAAPVLLRGTGVNALPFGGATAAEATALTGVVTVAAESGAGVAITFTGTLGTVTKNVLGQGVGTPVAVVLDAGDLTTLGQGLVNVSAVATDVAGNSSPIGTNSFTLDTV
ncbi:MAG: hypothetical protein EBX36_01105, partial [Planctomycetia bacterium]|nr:hypothetical protein [Planctomycetia bacterium]